VVQGQGLRVEPGAWPEARGHAGAGVDEDQRDQGMAKG
jgi:hypothetical protein